MEKKASDNDYRKMMEKVKKNPQDYEEFVKSGVSRAMRIKKKKKKVLDNKIY